MHWRHLSLLLSFGLFLSFGIACSQLPPVCDETTCNDGDTCIKGHCIKSCKSKETMCNATCWDLGTSKKHCGKCYNACKVGEACSQGICLPSCPLDFTRCEGNCVKLQSDKKHCGKCGVSCPSGRVCSKGKCQRPGKKGFTD